MNIPNICFILISIIVFFILNINKSHAIMCSICHGIDGNSFIKTWPKISGQYKKYIVNQILEYKTGTKGNRYDPIMFPIAKNLTKININKIASFYANQAIFSNELNIGIITNNLYVAGNIKFNISPCASCHGFNGRGNFLANFPKLSGQHSKYIINQMKKYKTLSRKTDPFKIMRTIMYAITVEEMNIIGSYISTLK